MSDFQPSSESNDNDAKNKDAANLPNYKQLYMRLKADNEDLEKRLKEKEEENQKLAAEASTYQYRLGAAADITLSDNDENNPVLFKKDILNLQNSLEDYTKCKGDVDLDYNEIQKLLE